MLQEALQKITQNFIRIEAKLFSYMSAAIYLQNGKAQKLTPDADKVSCSLFGRIFNVKNVYYFLIYSSFKNFYEKIVIL